MSEYMKRAILLAKKGLGTCRPNPMVGAVIVRDNTIIGEGWHAVCGGPHAERNAIADMKERGFDGHGATLYVTLEPCCHYGRTAPCTDAIIENGFSKVVIGSRDPNPLVSGKGVEILKEAGIEVVQDYMKEECDELNTVFFHYITTKTPYVTLKYAMTLDGKICTKTGASRWVSCDESLKYTHKLRKYNSAIMVGIGTVVTDNPLLTCRILNGINPIRVICDSYLRIPMSSNIIRTAESVRTIIATTESMLGSAAAEVLRNRGITIVGAGNGDRVDLKILMQKLGEMEIDSLLLEGGSRLVSSAIEEGIVDQIYTFMAPKIFGGEAKTPVGGTGVAKVDEAYKFEVVSKYTVGDDILIISRKKEN